MLRPKEINFKIKGVRGDLKLTYNAIGQPKLYQNGEQLKRKGLFRMKYLVETEKDDIIPQDYLEIRRGFSFVFYAIFRGEETPLQEKLSTVEYIIGIVPILLLVFLGGGLGAVIGFIGATANFNFMQTEKRIGLQILFALVVTLVCYLIYFLLAFGVRFLIELMS